VLDIVERLVDEHVEAAEQPGLAYGVLRDGALIHSGGRGVRRLTGPGENDAVPDADTLFRIASMTKSFTAATLLWLRDDGRLRLEDEVADHVPELARLRLPTTDSPPLTLRTLLTMAAGWPTDDPWGDRQQDLPDEELAALLRGGLGFAWAPGTAFEYSNLGYAVLGRVIATAAGQPYADVVTQRLLAPLGMTATGFTEDAAPENRRATGYRRAGQEWERVPVSGYGAFAPMGGLFSTVRDLARWVSFLADAFPPRDDPDDGPLRRASRRELQLPRLATPPVVTWRGLAEPPVARSLAYGFGLVVEHDPRLGTVIAHSGGYPGFGSHMRWHPATGLGVVVLANATYAPAARLASRLMDSLVEHHVSALSGARPPWPIPTGGSILAATESARRDVTRLISAWDDTVAERLLAMNIDLDEPIATRRDQWAEVVAAIGPLAPDDEPALSTSPGHCSWWLRGPGGRVQVEIRMSPELPPRVQTLTVTAVPHPSEALHRIGDRLCEVMADPAPRWPGDVAIAPEVLEQAHRQLAVAAAWAGRSWVGASIAGDGVTEATFRILGGRVPLQLALTIDPTSEAVLSVTLTPA
jgi:CubicO group peptidase (beta-lactamase class C family)